MPLDLKWDGDAWDDYCEWQKKDINILKRINTIIKEARRTPYEGLGKPEPLKGTLSGAWSRRITLKDRLVYAVEDGVLIILACKTHYGDK